MLRGFFFVVERSPNRMNQTLIATMTESGGHTIESGTNKSVKDMLSHFATLGNKRNPPQKIGKKKYLFEK
jgi:hypothetical protein